MTETVESEAGSAADKLVYEVPAGAKLTVGRPSLVVLPNGRLLVAFDESAEGLGVVLGHGRHQGDVLGVALRGQIVGRVGGGGGERGVCGGGGHRQAILEAI